MPSAEQNGDRVHGTGSWHNGITKEHTKSQPSNNSLESRLTEQLAPSHFEVKKLIGKGGFGKVYHVVRPSTGEEFALKVVNKKRMEEKGTIQRIVQEIEIQLQLEHPNIVKLCDFFEDQTHIFMVLELCTSSNLYKRLRSVKYFEVEDAKRYFIQIVSALSYLHAHGIVHRDLKLSNLLLSKNGDIKIADFGLATQIHDTDKEEQQTICGTPNYAAPEVCGVIHSPDIPPKQQRHGYGIQADVWSLGCLLYSMLVGKPPFPKQTLRNPNPVSQSEFQLKFPDHVPKTAQVLIQSLLQVSPLKRPKTSEILQKFEFCHTHEDIMATKLEKLHYRSPLHSSTTSQQSVTSTTRVPQKRNFTLQHTLNIPGANNSNESGSKQQFSLPLVSAGPFRNIQERFGHLLVQFLGNGTVVTESPVSGLTMVFPITGNRADVINETKVEVQFHNCPFNCGGYQKSKRPEHGRKGCHACLGKFSRHSIPKKLLDYYMHSHKCVEAMKASAPRVALDIPEGLCTLRGMGSCQELHVIWKLSNTKTAKYRISTGEIALEDDSGKCIHISDTGETRWLSGLYTVEREAQVLQSVDSVAVIAAHCIHVLQDYENAILQSMSHTINTAPLLPCVLRGTPEKTKMTSGSSDEDPLLRSVEELSRAFLSQSCSRDVVQFSGVRKQLEFKSSEQNLCTVLEKDSGSSRCSKGPSHQHQRMSHTSSEVDPRNREACTSDVDPVFSRNSDTCTSDVDPVFSRNSDACTSDVDPVFSRNSDACTSDYLVHDTDTLAQRKFKTDSEATSTLASQDSDITLEAEDGGAREEASTTPLITETVDKFQVTVAGLGTGKLLTNGEVKVSLEDGTNILVDVHGTYRLTTPNPATPLSVLKSGAKIPKEHLTLVKSCMKIVRRLRESLVDPLVT